MLQWLFALADESPMQVAKYQMLGVVLVARDGTAIVGHVQVTPTEDAAVQEIKSLAVDTARQGEGIGRALVKAALNICRERSAQSVIVATATADIDNLRFYQRCGFRMDRIVHDVFTKAAGYTDTDGADGLVLRDQVYFSIVLN